MVKRGHDPSFLAVPPTLHDSSLAGRLRAPGQPANSNPPAAALSEPDAISHPPGILHTYQRPHPHPLTDTA